MSDLDRVGRRPVVAGIEALDAFFDPALMRTQMLDQRRCLTVNETLVDLRTMEKRQ